MRKRKVAIIAGVAMAAMLTAGCTAADTGPTGAPSGDEAWTPSGPIKLIVPYGAGGSTDTIGRLLADKMEDILKVPVVVENVPGGVGAVGVQQVYNAKADGQTLVMASGSIQTIVPHTTDLGYDPYDMTFVASTHESVAARFVPSSKPWKTIEELVDYGKDPKNTLIDVTSGGFGLPDIGTKLLSAAVGGLNYRPLATDGGAESVLRLLAGDADMGQNSASTTMQYVESGELRPLLIESASWPELEKLGVPKSSDLYGYTIVNPSSILAPPGLPENIRSVLENAVKVALDDQAVFDKMAATHELVRFKTGEEARSYAKQGYDLYGPIIKEVLG